MDDPKEPDARKPVRYAGQMLTPAELEDLRAEAKESLRIIRAHRERLQAEGKLKKR